MRAPVAIINFAFVVRDLPVESQIYIHIHIHIHTCIHICMYIYTRFTIFGTIWPFFWTPKNIIERHVGTSVVLFLTLANVDVIF